MSVDADNLSVDLQEGNQEVREELSNLISLLEMTSESLEGLTQYDTEGMFSEGSNSVLEQLIALGSAAENVASELTDAANNAAQAFAEMAASSDAVIAVMSNAEGALNDAQSRLVSELEPTVEALSNGINESVEVLNAIAGLATEGQSTIETETSEVLEFLDEFVQELDNVSERLDNSFSGLSSEFESLISETADSHQQTIVSHLDSLKTMVADKQQQVESDLSNISEQLAETFEELTQAISTAIDTLKSDGIELIEGAIETIDNSPLDDAFENILSTAEQLENVANECLESATEGNAILEPIHDVISMVSGVRQKLLNFKEELLEAVGV